MTQPFAAWLKENKHNFYAMTTREINDRLGTCGEKDGFLSVRALGERFLEEAIFWRKDADCWDCPWSQGKWMILRELALACLGPAEVKKRLEAKGE